MQGDAVLAGAVWRNLFKGDENVDWTKVAKVVAFMRKSLQELDGVEVNRLGAALSTESGLVSLWTRSWVAVTQTQSRQSKGVNEPFKETL